MYHVLFIGKLVHSFNNHKWALQSTSSENVLITFPFLSVPLVKTLIKSVTLEIGITSSHYLCAFKRPHKGLVRFPTPIHPFPGVIAVLE